MKKQRPMLWRVLVALAASAMLLAACGDDGGGAEASASSIQTGQVGNGDDDDTVDAQHGGKIVVGVETETNEWSPATGQFAAPGTMIALAIYDPLIVLDADGDFAPFLAESMEPNEDLTEWTLRLREGVTFHDGTTLDAEVLKWNWDTLHFADGSRNRGSLNNAGALGMEVVDELTVRYELAEPNAAFPDLLRTYIGYPISREAYEANPEGFGSHPVGTGPFKFQSWNRDDRLVVERNPDYWMTTESGDQLPYLDEIEFRVIPDDESRVASLQADDIQVIQTLRGPSIKRVLAMVDAGGYEASLFIGNASSVTLVNTLVPPVDDVRVRRALAYANDQEAMAKVRDDDGLVPPASGFFSEDSPWYSADAVSDYPGVNGRDEEKARELIEEYRSDPNRSDGKAPGSPFTIGYECQPDPSLLQGAQLLQGLWLDIGVELELKQVDQAAMIANVVGTADTDPPYRGSYTLACYRAGGGEGDPFTALQNAFGPVATTSGNSSNFTHPRIDEALDQLKSSGDFATRYEAVEEISRVAAEFVPYIWNVNTPTLVGYREDIKGIPAWTLPDGSPGTATSNGIARFHAAHLVR